MKAEINNENEGVTFKDCLFLKTKHGIKQSGQILNGNGKTFDRCTFYISKYPAVLFISKKSLRPKLTPKQKIDVFFRVLYGKLRWFFNVILKDYFTDISNANNRFVKRVKVSWFGQA